MITAFFTTTAAAPVPAGDHAIGVIGDGIQAGERDRTMNGGRLESWLRCPCCVRRAEAVMRTMRKRVASALAAAGLAALAAWCLSGGPVQAAPAAGAATPLMSSAGRWWAGGPPAHAADTSRVVLIAISVAAVGAFVALQIIARSRHRRLPTFAGWRTWPPGYDPETGACHGDPALADRQPWTCNATCLRYVYR